MDKQVVLNFFLIVFSSFLLTFTPYQQKIEAQEAATNIYNQSYFSNYESSSSFYADSDQWLLKSYFDPHGNFFQNNWLDFSPSLSPNQWSNYPSLVSISNPAQWTTFTDKYNNNFYHPNTDLGSRMGNYIYSPLTINNFSLFPFTNTFNNSLLFLADLNLSPIIINPIPNLTFPTLINNPPFKYPINSTGQSEESCCGRSTYGQCSTDSDCMESGCSGQICQSRSEEELGSTCEWLECYQHCGRCKCIMGKCQWSSQ